MMNITPVPIVVAAEAHLANVERVASSLNGKWIVDHKSSDAMGPVLEIMGFSWIFRVTLEALPLFPYIYSVDADCFKVDGGMTPSTDVFFFAREVQWKAFDGTQYSAALGFDASGDLFVKIAHSCGDIITTYVVLSPTRMQTRVAIVERATGIVLRTMQRTLTRG